MIQNAGSSSNPGFVVRRAKALTLTLHVLAERLEHGEDVPQLDVGFSTES